MTAARGCCVALLTWARLSVCEENLERAEPQLEPFHTDCLYSASCHHSALCCFLLGSQGIYSLTVVSLFFVFCFFFRRIFQIGFEMKLHRNNIFEESYRESCLWKDQMSWWKLGCGLSLNQRKVWTTGRGHREWFFLLPKEMFNSLLRPLRVLRQKYLECIQNVSPTETGLFLMSKMREVRWWESGLPW